MNMNRIRSYDTFYPVLNRSTVHGKSLDWQVTRFDCEIRSARTFDQGQGGWREGKIIIIIIIIVDVHNKECSFMLNGNSLKCAHLMCMKWRDMVCWWTSSHTDIRLRKLTRCQIAPSSLNRYHQVLMEWRWQGLQCYFTTRLPPCASHVVSDHHDTASSDLIKNVTKG